jgi:predicted PP-loop superfamily ATPase
MNVSIPDLRNNIVIPPLRKRKEGNYVVSFFVRRFATMSGAATPHAIPSEIAIGYVKGTVKAKISPTFISTAKSAVTKDPNDPRFNPCSVCFGIIRKPLLP